MNLRPLAPLPAFLLLTAFVEEPPRQSLPANLIPVPILTQRTDFSCGDVAVLSILRYWNGKKWNRVGEKKLYEPLKTSSKAGTEPTPMAKFLSREPGLKGEFKHGSPTIKDLEAAIDRGEPTIVCIQAWQAKDDKADFVKWKTDWADGHYVVLNGYDAKNFYFMDPSTPKVYAFIPRREFADRWHDVLGAAERHAQHITIFVRSTLPKPPKPARAPPKKAAPLN